jgi:hypothetical protein
MTGLIEEKARVVLKRLLNETGEYDFRGSGLSLIFRKLLDTFEHIGMGT